MCLVYTAAMRAVHYLVIAIFHLRVREAELVTAVGTAALRAVHRHNFVEMFFRGVGRVVTATLSSDHGQSN